MNWENVVYEDVSIPVYLLQRGVEKLVKYGMPTFLQYSQEVGLSYCDINRVIAKARMAWGKTELKEMPCPPEMRQKRWECYTKRFRYSENKAKELIKQIDSIYYGNQPIPNGKMEDLTSGMLKDIPKTPKTYHGPRPYIESK